MAKRLNKNQDSDALIDIVEVRDQAQNFYEDNQKYILGGVLALVVLVGGWFAYKNFYKAPREAEAMTQMAQAQLQFERDSFALALANPGSGFSGFADISANYRGTNAGNLALYYAGICCLNLGQFEAAIDYLKDFDPEGEITPAMKSGALGDAYSETNDMDSALSYYKKAASATDNALIASYYMKKLGMFYEKQGKTEDALETYQSLKDKYPNSPYVADIDKYIIRVSPKG